MAEAVEFGVGGEVPLRPPARAGAGAPELGAAVLVLAPLMGMYLLAPARPRPGSALGIALGAAGLLVMIGGTAGYAWRKRRSGPGALQRWLELHVVSGLVGPVLILLHSGLALRGLAGAAFALMAAVVASGLAGRYLFTARPSLRRRTAGWWAVHVPLAFALFALAVVHALAALYFVWR